MNKKTIYNFVKKYHISKPAFIAYSIIICLIIYFFLFTIFGQKGVIAMFRLQEKIENVGMAKEGLVNKLNNKKNMVDGISGESLDLDLLDEQSRKVLGYVGKNEVVIYQNEEEKKDEPKN